MLLQSASGVAPPLGSNQHRAWYGSGVSLQGCLLAGRVLLDICEGPMCGNYADMTLRCNRRKLKTGLLGEGVSGPGDIEAMGNVAGGMARQQAHGCSRCRPAGALHAAHAHHAACYPGWYYQVVPGSTRCTV
jgi:hypothetical protein